MKSEVKQVSGWTRALWPWVGAVVLVLSTTLAGCARPARSACYTADDCDPGEVCDNGRCMPSHVMNDASTSLPDSSPPPPDGSNDDPDSDFTCAEVSFDMTETDQAFAVPQNVTYMHVKAWGAGGNGEGTCGTNQDGGLGGYSEAVFAVTPGTELIIIVGKRGRAGTSNEDIIRYGFGHWGGGGLSGVFLGPAPISEDDNSRALIIAGGGGGGSAPGCQPGGTGNHPDSGGMPSMMGGHGADDVNGGGGGYLGGAGGARGLAGMGGTGYISGTAVDSVMEWAQPLDMVPPRTNDPDYDGTAGQTETSGLVVIHFVCEPPPVR